MATLAPHQPAETAPSHWQEGNPGDDALAHIPGEGGWPIVGNTFKMLADPHGELAAALGLLVNMGPVLGNRATRCAIIVDDGTVTKVLMEEVGVFEVSSATHVLTQL